MGQRASTYEEITQKCIECGNYFIENAQYGCKHFYCKK